MTVVVGIICLVIGIFLGGSVTIILIGSRDERNDE